MWVYKCLECIPTSYGAFLHFTTTMATLGNVSGRSIASLMVVLLMNRLEESILFSLHPTNTHDAILRNTANKRTKCSCMCVCYILLEHVPIDPYYVCQMLKVFFSFAISMFFHVLFQDNLYGFFSLNIFLPEANMISA